MLLHEKQLGRKQTPLSYRGSPSSQHDAQWHGRPSLPLDHRTINCTLQ